MTNLYKISKTVPVIVINIFLWINELACFELKQVNVLFRHGDRTPTMVYPLIPITSEHYFPAGYGALTNKGKKRAHELGEMLRARYDDFLGSTYLPEDIKAISTDYDRTKMSLQLVLSGLYPPNSQQKWNTDLNWQPIPTHYKPIPEDHLFTPSRQCKMYREEQKKIKESPKVAEKLSSFKYLIKNISRLTGVNMIDDFPLCGLYTDLESMKEMGLDLPNWVHDFYPDGPLLDVLLTNTDILSYNDVSKRLQGGKFIRQFLDNMLTVTENSLEVKERKKIFLYGGHDINMVAILLALNLDGLIITKFTSAVIVELLSIDNNYYVRIFYYLGIPPITKEMKIPNCQSPCPLEDFRNLTKMVTPSDEEFKCV